jgi:isopentenyldiphosphate isomerase
MSDEWFPLVDEASNVIGQAMRREVHGNPSLMHPVVHCLVENTRGELLLQLRSMQKDVQPGRWDTSVGGHVAWGESIETALLREVAEEIGLTVPLSRFQFLHRYVMRSSIETELVHTYRLFHDGPFVAQPSEVDRLEFFGNDAIRARLGTGDFTPNFEDEYRRYQEALGPCP